MITIGNLVWWQFLIVMVIIIALLIVPVVSYFVHKKLAKKGSRKQTTPPLMYITAVSATRTADVDIPVLPRPGDASFLPPSYEEICKGMDNQAYYTSSTTINMDAEALPDYASVASQRSSIVLSTFYNDNASSCARSVSAMSYDEEEHNSQASDIDEDVMYTRENDSEVNEVVIERSEMGVYVA